MKDKIKNILEKTEYIIPNLDIDGLFTATILKQIKPTIKTIGFSNSHDIVYYFKKDKDENSFKKCNTLFIDLYTKDYMCIDQHVVSYTNDYNFLLKVCNDKLNPNVEFDRIGKSPNYYWKYPFSSALWLIYCLNRIDININFDYDKIVFDDITLCELFFHTDSMLFNKIDKEHRYETNVLKWWDILLEGNENNNINELYKRYMSLSDDRIEYLHNKIGDVLSERFKCKKNGGYSKIYPNQKNYINDFSNLICNNMNVEPIIIDFINEELYEKKFKENKKIIITNDNDFNEIINKENVFSLAFVFNNTINYSYS